MFKKRKNSEKDLKNIILAEIEKEDVQIIQTAYCYAKNLHLYGVDVGEKWETTIQQTCALEKAKKVGYYEALEEISRAREIPVGHWEWVQYDANPEIGNFHCSECRFIPASFNMAKEHLHFCPNCGAMMRGDN